MRKVFSVLGPQQFRITESEAVAKSTAERLEIPEKTIEICCPRR